MRGRRDQVGGRFTGEQIDSYGQQQRSRVRWDDAARQELWPMQLRHAGLNLAERPCETAFLLRYSAMPNLASERCGVAMTMLTLYSHMAMVS
jgi:hypothetical protein